MDDYNTFLREKYEEMKKNEQRWESILTEDAELILVAYGISARVCKEAVSKARKQGIRLGLIRPILFFRTLWTHLLIWEKTAERL